MGASSTGGGTINGRGGSGMAPWTGISLRILRRVDGDEDLAPRVFAMAISEKVGGGACVAWAQMGSHMERCFGLPPLWHLRQVQMTGLK